MYVGQAKSYTQINDAEALIYRRGFDGNKRVAFQVMHVFLRINGQTITTEEEEVVRLVLTLAGGDLSEAELVIWLEANTAPR